MNLKFKEWLNTTSEITINENINQLDDELYNIYSNLPGGINGTDFHIFIKEYGLKIIYNYFLPYNFKMVRFGRNRFTLLSSERNVVIKIPVNELGIEDNLYEYKNQKGDYRGGEHARCKLIMLNKLKLPILVSEKIIENRYEEKPEWAKSYDGLQVGKNKRGIFKAYDYGIK